VGETVPAVSQGRAL